MRRQWTIGMTMVCAGVAVMAQGGQSLGGGVKLTEPTSIASVYETPDRFVGKTIRVDGGRHQRAAALWRPYGTCQ